MTTFENKCLILSTIWLAYQDDIDFADFVLAHEMALAFANAIDEGIMATTTIASDLINVAYDELLAGFGLTDSGFEHMDDLVSAIQDQ